ncbi:ras and Rab interactor 3 [Sarcophilus harrisii]|uniref:Ras and Rab interactor 3 n=1 Tax=Sarcophilus harrisii TaxID=9305 RepID=A0A7N4V0Q1_SARHA|nr:ras and Rab interactor 3 [Sarcophilus harrisii]XP_031808160.1 ras and Rab interactor 3 [Sarcophilus harrisii]
MMKPAGDREAGDHPGPFPNVGQGEKEEKTEEGEDEDTESLWSAALRNRLPRGISVLEKLIATCPVWLQLDMDRDKAAQILQGQTTGIFLVRRESNLKHMILSVHFPSLNESLSDVLEYNIKEEKSILYLEGSVLVFEDIFKLIAFYCVSRDLLPFTLRLPQAILEANNFKELETISNLGLGFWDSSLNPRKRKETLGLLPKDSALATPLATSLRSPSCYANCSCEIELSIGNDRLWFVNPIFIEDCSSSLSSDEPLLQSSQTSSDPPVVSSSASTRIPRRRPPPPPLPPPPLSFAPAPAAVGPLSPSALTVSAAAVVPPFPPPSTVSAAAAVPLSPAPTVPAAATVPPSPPPLTVSAAAAIPLSPAAPPVSVVTAPPSTTVSAVITPLSPPASSVSAAAPLAPPAPPVSSATDAPLSALAPTVSSAAAHAPLSLRESSLSPVPSPCLPICISSAPPTELPEKSGQQPLTPCAKVPPRPVNLRHIGEDHKKETVVSYSSPQFLASKKGTRPAIPPRRRLSERISSEDNSMVKTDRAEGLRGQEEQQGNPRTISKSPPTQKAPAAPGRTMEQVVQVEEPVQVGGIGNGPEQPKKTKQPPIPPPRKKRISRQLASYLPSQLENPELIGEQPSGQTIPSLSITSSPAQEGPTTHSVIQGEVKGTPQSLGSSEFTGSIASLADSLGTPTLTPDQDSYSTSSTEDDPDQYSNASVKKKSSVILGKAKHRLSFVSFSNVFNAFLSSNRKLQKKVVELAQDKETYFGNLVQDYKVYSLEMMAKQSSSTEMLQEIRMMMTQLKSYLLQSTELKSLVDLTLHSEEELEAIVESALYKCVLKPLKEAINSHLQQIHSKDGTLQLLKGNQLVILATTTTDLGVTTSVPEVSVMEKILHKFTSMHKAYSPEKKIAILLKSCKLIYDSMALGNPGKPYGADDFLPVLMYVLARSNLTEMLLNVEYMMELMDPALQLGEGSYYLTTTYGALEHIKNYDKITVTRQLSVEVQDSIHRWERRRTLNKARASRSSVQDFICISFLEPDNQARTLASKSDTLAEQLRAQCAEKFEVAQPQDHRLFVLVDGKCFQLADDSLPHHIKAYLLKSEPKRDFHFIYKAMDRGESQPPIVKEPNFL